MLKRQVRAHQPQPVLAEQRPSLVPRTRPHRAAVHLCSRRSPSARRGRAAARIQVRASQRGLLAAKHARLPLESQHRLCSPAPARAGHRPGHRHDHSRCDRRRDRLSCRARARAAGRVRADLRADARPSRAEAQCGRRAAHRCRRSRCRSHSAADERSPAHAHADGCAAREPTEPISTPPP
eukprot:2652644-Pleurochrysis_carterae.AAC.1